MTETAIAAQIEQYVRRQFAVADDDARFGREVSLFDTGYVDSVGLVELLAFCETEFNAQIPDDDLLADDFATIAGMAATIFRVSAQDRTN